MQLQIKKEKKNMNKESRTSATKCGEDGRQTTVFQQKTINQLILYFSVPAIISLLLESFVSMIDTVFAGHLGSMSSVALSSMGIINPILSLLVAVQLIFGVSTGIVIAKEIGENDSKKINNTFKVGIYSTIIFTSFISLIIFLGENKLLDIIGAYGSVRILAKQYLNIALIYNVFSSMGYTLVNSIRSFGYPKMEIVIITSSTIINIIFNMIFTFIFHMGIVGIGLATLISEISYVMFAYTFLNKKKLWIKKGKIKLNECKVILIALVKIGFVQFLMQSLTSLNGFTVNRVLINYGESLYIGAWSICNSIYMMLLLPLIGFTESMQSVMAYYQGSHNNEYKKILKSKTLRCSLVYAVFTTIIVYIFSNTVVGIFTLDKNIINSATSITKIMILGFPFMGVIYTLVGFMQVSGQEENASKLEFIRQVFIFIPLCVVIPVLISKFNMINMDPGMGVFYAMPISNMISLFFYAGVKIR